MSSERLEKFKSVTYANTKSQAKTELQYIFEKATGECQLESPSPFYGCVKKSHLLLVL